MARGWESKSVEEGIEARERERPAPIPGASEPGHARAVADLRLQREAILNQRTSNEHRRAALQAALAEVEARMRALGKEP